MNGKNVTTYFDLNQYSFSVKRLNSSQKYARTHMQTFSYTNTQCDRWFHLCVFASTQINLMWVESGWTSCTSNENKIYSTSLYVCMRIIMLICERVRVCVCAYTYKSDWLSEYVSECVCVRVTIFMSMCTYEPHSFTCFLGHSHRYLREYTAILKEESNIKWLAQREREKIVSQFVQFFSR